MKKYTLFAAAFAMLAFAGCNKEENQVALEFGGENYASTDKQAFESDYIYFTAGDQVWVNGVQYEVSPINNGLYARVWCDPSNTGYDVHYGDVAFNGASWTTTFKNEVTLIPMESRTTIGANHQPWPMSGKIAAGESTTGFKLLNNVAVLGPAIKYGKPFAQKMWENIDRVDQNVSTTIDENNLPVLAIQKVVISSSDIKLSGTATLNDNVPGQPIFVMNDTPAGVDSIVCNVNPAYSVVPSANVSERGYGFGNVCIAPVYLGFGESRHLTIAYHFTATIDGHTYAYIYRNEGIITNSITRATRCSLFANFFNPTMEKLLAGMHCLGEVN